MRTLTSNTQCEHETRVFGTDGVVVKARCQIKHHERINGGPPQQLVVVVENRKTRFLCLQHAPECSVNNTTRRQKRSAPVEEQVNLL